MLKDIYGVDNDEYRILKDIHIINFDLDLIEKRRLELIDLFRANEVDYEWFTLLVDKMESKKFSRELRLKEFNKELNKLREKKEDQSGEEHY